MVRTQTVLQHLKIMHDMQRQTLPAELKRRQTRGNDGWALNMPTVLRRHIHQHRDGRAVAYTRYRRCVLRGIFGYLLRILGRKQVWIRERYPKIRISPEARRRHRRRSPVPDMGVIYMLTVSRSDQ